MAIDKRLISVEKAREMIEKGEAVKAGSEGYLRMMADLWAKVSKKFVFVAIAGLWFYREDGADRVPVKEHSAQRVVDKTCRSKKLVITYGNKEGMATGYYESPQLNQVTNAFLEEALEPFRKPQAGNPFHDLIVDFMDTYPNQGPIVEAGENRIWNLWTQPWVKPTDKITSYKRPQWFLEVVERFFGEYHTEREWFLDWCAHLIVRPDVKMPVSVLLTSSLNGAGKGFIAKALEYLVGPRNYKNLTPEIIKGGFQSFLLGTTLGVVHELYEQGNYGFADKLKTFQSEDSLFVNLKYGPQQNTRNMVHLLCFSNRSSPIHLDEGDRRWFTFASPEKDKASQEWWDKRWKILKHPEYNGMPHKMSLGNLRKWFEWRYEEIKRTGRFRPFDRPPETEHKTGLVDDSRTPFYIKLKEMLKAGRVPAVREGYTNLAAIEGDLGLTMLPPNGQKRHDLESLGFTPKKLGDGTRVWKVPEGFQTVGPFKLGPRDAPM